MDKIQSLLKSINGNLFDGSNFIIRDRLRKFFLEEYRNPDNIIESSYDDLLWKKSCYELVNYFKKNKKEIMGKHSLFESYKHHLSLCETFYSEYFLILEKYLRKSHFSDVDDFNANIIKNKIAGALINLGDIERYKQEIDYNFDYNKCLEYYKRAAIFNYNSENPLNKLGLFYHSNNNDFNAVYYYLRGMLAIEKCNLCPPNLLKCLSKYMDESISHSIIDSSDLISFNFVFLNIVSSWFGFNKMSIEIHGKFIQYLKNKLYALVERSLDHDNDYFLCKLMIICITSLGILKISGSIHHFHAADLLVYFIKKVEEISMERLRDKTYNVFKKDYSNTQNSMNFREDNNEETSNDNNDRYLNDNNFDNKNFIKEDDNSHNKKTSNTRRRIIEKCDSSGSSENDDDFSDKSYDCNYKDAVSDTLKTVNSVKEEVQKEPEHTACSDFSEDRIKILYVKRLYIVSMKLYLDWLRCCPEMITFINEVGSFSVLELFKNVIETIPDVIAVKVDAPKNLYFSIDSFTLGLPFYKHLHKNLCISFENSIQKIEIIDKEFLSLIKYLKVVVNTANIFRRVEKKYKVNKQKDGSRSIKNSRNEHQKTVKKSSKKSELSNNSKFTNVVKIVVSTSNGIKSSSKKSNENTFNGTMKPPIKSQLDNEPVSKLDDMFKMALTLGQRKLMHDISQLEQEISVLNKNIINQEVAIVVFEGYAICSRLDAFKSIVKSKLFYCLVPYDAIQIIDELKCTQIHARLAGKFIKSQLQSTNKFMCMETNPTLIKKVFNELNEHIRQYSKKLPQDKCPNNLENVKSSTIRDQTDKNNNTFFNKIRRLYSVFDFCLEKLGELSNKSYLTLLLAENDLKNIVMNEDHKSLFDSFIRYGLIIESIDAFYQKHYNGK